MLKKIKPTLKTLYDVNKSKIMKETYQ